MKFIDNLSPATKGLFAIAIGLILLLDRFNFFHDQLKNIIFIGAIILIIYGLILGSFITKISRKLRGASDQPEPKA